MRWPRPLVSLALVLGCAGPGARSLPAAAPPAVSVRPALPRWPVKAPGFVGEVEGLAAPVLQPREDAFVLSVPVGPPSPLTCFVYRAPHEVGTLLHRLMARAAGHRRVRSARITDVRLVGEAPAVFAELAYRADSPGARGAVDGRVRLMVHGDPDRPLACLLDAPGAEGDFVVLAWRAPCGDRRPRRSPSRRPVRAAAPTGHRPGRRARSRRRTCPGAGSAGRPPSAWPRRSAWRAHRPDGPW